MTRSLPILPLLLIAALPQPASAYIHFPPMTLPKMCKDSHFIRLLKVTKVDKEKGVIVFELAEALKARDKTPGTSFRHAMRPDAEASKKILAWAGDGKSVVMFSIEAPGGNAGIAYVFIDEYCYTVDYNHAGKYWWLIRGEPGMSACYHGSVDNLRSLVKDVLAGKDVRVPVKTPDKKEDAEKRRSEVTETLQKNRRGGP